MKSTEKKGIAIAAAVLFAWTTVFAQEASKDDFVRREGTHLALAGQPYRFGGPNIEWLGLEGYGPHDPAGPRLASRFEIDDAFDTALEMGARVVRSQTMGDTVGCPLCIEPRKSEFNDAGFQSSDYALAAAGRRGMRVIMTLVGDCAACAGGGIGQYLAWEHKTDLQDFFRDPALIAAYEEHVDAVLNHVNRITGLRYKDDPTILAWENCNMCGILAALMGSQGNMAEVAAWVETVGRHIKQADPKHLYLDTSGIFPFYGKALDNPSPDMATFEYYPHWAVQLGGALTTTPATFARDAANVTGHGKVYIVNEFGWDRTNWKTTAELQEVLDTLARDGNVSGDLFWALQAHLDNFGFQPIPADSRQLPFAEKGECGEWWALYYSGIKTLVNSAEDMAQRVQQLRSHAFAMAGKPVPKHMAPAAPAMTSVVLGGLVAWRGSAGAVRYSIQRMSPGAKEWQTVCDQCATDGDDPWIDPKPLLGARYRVIALNADGVASVPSDPK